MQPHAILIQQPCLDFGEFLSVASQAMGYSPSEMADSTSHQLHDAEKFLSCLASLKARQTPLHFAMSPHLMSHVSFSVLIMSDDRDMLDILEICSGMPFVVSDTVARGIQIAVVTGSLNHWKDSVISGSQYTTEPSVRMLFNGILSLFESVNLNVWRGLERETQVDSTFLLEDKR